MDSDCPSGELCSPSYLPGCYPGPSYFCRTPQDECIADTDCKNGGTCAFDTNKNYWACGNACIDG